jgi:hypothetical protein
MDLIYLLVFFDVEGEVMQADLVNFEAMFGELGLRFPDIDRDAAGPGRILTVRRWPFGPSLMTSPIS